MLIEVNPNPDDPTTTAFETFELLQAEGYSPYWFDGEKLLPRKAGGERTGYPSSLPSTKLPWRHKIAIPSMAA